MKRRVYGTILGVGRGSWCLLALTCLSASALPAQCPDGSPPPCVSRRAAIPARETPIAELRRLTTSGRVTLARLSNDERLLAYVQDSALYVSTLVTGSRPVMVSRDLWRFGTGIWWLPDHTRLLTRGDSGIYILPSLGGTPQTLSRFPLRNLSLSPDGRVVLVSGDKRTVAQLFDVESRAPRNFVLPGTDTVYHEHAWSPNGRSIALVTSDGRSRYQLLTASVASGASRVVIRDSVNLVSPQWDSSTSSILYVRRTDAGAQLWRQPMTAAGDAKGSPRMVLPFIETRAFHLVGNGDHLAYVRTEATQNYFVRGLGNDGTSIRLTGDASTKPFAGRLSPDGVAVIFPGVDAAGHNVWFTRADSIAPEQLTFFRDRQIASVAWAPDGRRIAVCGSGTSGPFIDVAAVDTREVRSLAVRNVSPTCQMTWVSPDAVAYHLGGNRNFAVHSVSTGSESRLVAGDSIGWMFDPALDPLHTRVAVTWNRRPPEPGIWLIGLHDSSQRKLGPYFSPLRFSADGSVLYVTPLDHRRLVSMRLEDGTISAAHVAPGSCYILDVSPDGKRLLCHETESIKRDLWVIRNFDSERVGGQALSRP